MAPGSGRRLPGQKEEEGHEADEDGHQQARADDIPGSWFHAHQPLWAQVKGQDAPYMTVTIVELPRGATVTRRSQAPVPAIIS